MTDDLDRLLGPPAGEPDERLQAAIRERTGRVVARRRWGRLGGKLALGAGLFAAGVGVGWTGKPTPRLSIVAPPPLEVIAVPVLVPVTPPRPSPPPDPYLTADRLEQAAELADRAEAARLYQKAGDKYLTDAGEPGQAARCYRLSLQHAGPDGLTVEPADSWLLSSLKSQRKREVRDGGAHGL